MIEMPKLCDNHSCIMFYRQRPPSSSGRPKTGARPIGTGRHNSVLNPLPDSAVLQPLEKRLLKASLENGIV